MRDDELCYMPATEALARFRDKSLSPVELMAAVIARAEQTEPKLNAITYRHFDEAMDSARKAEARYAKGGRTRALEGLPVAIKDESYIKGKPTSNGSLILKDHVADHTSPVNERILRAGAAMGCVDGGEDGGVGVRQPLAEEATKLLRAARAHQPATPLRGRQLHGLDALGAVPVAERRVAQPALRPGREGADHRGQSVGGDRVLDGDARRRAIGVPVQVVQLGLPFGAERGGRKRCHGISQEVVTEPGRRRGRTPNLERTISPRRPVATRLSPDVDARLHDSVERATQAPCRRQHG